MKATKIWSQNSNFLKNTKYINAEINVTARISRKPLKNRKLTQITQMWYLGDIHPYHIDIQCKTPISRPTATHAKFPVKRRNCWIKTHTTIITPGYTLSHDIPRSTEIPVVTFTPTNWEFRPRNSTNQRPIRDNGLNQTNILSIQILWRSLEIIKLLQEQLWEDKQIYIHPHACPLHDPRCLFKNLEDQPSAPAELPSASWRNQHKYINTGRYTWTYNCVKLVLARE